MNRIELRQDLSECFIDNTYDYSLPFLVVNYSRTPAAQIFSNIPALSQGTVVCVGYKEKRSRAPDVFQLRLASNEYPLLCEIPLNHMAVISVNQEINDTWYARPEYFTVKLIDLDKF
jgi:hypothetical protein